MKINFVVNEKDKVLTMLCPYKSVFLVIQIKIKSQSLSKLYFLGTNSMVKEYFQ